MWSVVPLNARRLSVNEHDSAVPKIADDRYWSGWSAWESDFHGYLMLTY